MAQKLFSFFFCYNQVKAVELSPHTDYQLKATVHMLSLQQAISAVSGLHRYKIGGKRIQVSLTTGGGSKSLVLLRYKLFLNCLIKSYFFMCVLFKFTLVTSQLRDHHYSPGCSSQLPSPLQVH